LFIIFYKTNLKTFDINKKELCARRERENQSKSVADERNKFVYRLKEMLKI